MYLLTVIGVIVFSIGLVIGLREMMTFHRIKSYNCEQQQQGLSHLLHKIGVVRGVLLDKYTTDKTGQRWDGFKSFTITEKIKESNDVYSFLLKPNDNNMLAGFFPGQHVMVQADVQGHSQTISRAYSLSDAPGKLESYRITVKKQQTPNDNPNVPPGLMSAYLADVITTGDQLKLSAPAGHFCLDITQQKPLVMIAGGIGITPFISMINAEDNSDRNREMWLFYSTQNSDTRIMYDHIKAVSNHNQNLRVIMCYSAENANTTLNAIEQDQGSRIINQFGRITVDLLTQHLPSIHSEFFICGTKPMMEQMKANLLELQIPEQDIHFEVVHRSSRTLLKQINTGKSHDDTIVSFSRSGKQVKWHDGDEGTSILTLAEFNGIFIRNSCRSGECGMCRTKITKGEVLHLVANDEAMKVKGTCLPCVAVPNSKEIILEI